MVRPLGDYFLPLASWWQAVTCLGLLLPLIGYFPAPYKMMGRGECLRDCVIGQDIRCDPSFCEVTIAGRLVVAVSNHELATIISRGVRYDALQGQTRSALVHSPHELLYANVVELRLKAIRPVIG